MSDIFVVNKYLHTILRFIAAFIIAPILMYKGYIYQDLIIFSIGFLTLIVDSWTFYKSLILRIILLKFQ